MKLLRVVCTTSLVAISLAGSRAMVQAQTDESEPKPLHLKVGSTDRAAVYHYSDMRVRVLPRQGSSLARDITSLSLGTMTPATKNAKLALKADELRPNAVPSTPLVPSPGFYPDDLTYFGGAVVPSAGSVNIYLNNPSSEWGHPGSFIHDWNIAPLSHVVDQYVGATSNRRYPLAATGILEYPILATLGDNDLLQIVHVGAAAFGSGYGLIYHVFLPQGVDYCSGGQCYSPDNLSTFNFCAFHGSVTFSDVGHVLFTLEPYQAVDGCAVAPGSPNGQLVDSTSSVLSHELSETITDPDGDAWLAVNSLSTLYEEIGDLCQSVDLNGPFFLNPISDLIGKPYAVQLEYSNKYHACANKQ